MIETVILIVQASESLLAVVKNGRVLTTFWKDNAQVSFFTKNIIQQ